MNEDDVRTHLGVSRDLRRALYKPNKWLSTPRRHNHIHFDTISFSKTEFSEVTFVGCTFTDCLFIGSKFVRTEFHRCRFINCNFYKASFDTCYVDPRTFTFNKTYRASASNVVVETYQRLYDNSLKAGQIDFARYADFEFRRWKRWQLRYDFRNGKMKRLEYASRYVANFTYELLAGYGYKPSRFVLATLALFTLVACFNRVFLSGVLVHQGVTIGEMTWPDAVFYTYSIMTVLGFSTIVPASGLAQVLTVSEALIGVGWLGIFTSLLVKRFIR
jgi:hypothetical protein